jgi:hypothetical protein
VDVHDGIQVRQETKIKRYGKRVNWSEGIARDLLLWLTQIAASLLVQIARQSAAKVPKLAASLRVLCDIYVFKHEGFSVLRGLHQVSALIRRAALD